MSFAIPDSVGAALNYALDGLSTRQQVIADNIANVDTPGFRATSVDFENSLRAAISNGRLDAEPSIATTPTATPVGANGNNVDLRKESLAAIQSQFQYQVITRAVSDRSSILSMIAGA